ncbi:MAG: T9SS type A sorting domain-containing protein [Bacteroidota bacterium]
MKVIRKLLLVSFVIVGVLHAQGILNSGFELGRNNGWTESSTGNFTLISTAAGFASATISPAVTPHSGQYIARIGGFNYEVNSISQTVALPNTTPLYLKFYYQDRNDVGSECNALWGGQIRVYIAGQKLLDTYICYYSQKEVWTAGYFDLSAAAGQTVEMKFQADAAHSSWSFLYLDDISFTNTTDVEKEKDILPNSFVLLQNYPNPFNPTTMISYQLPTKAYTTLKVYDEIGREVATLVNELKGAGYYSVTFDASKYSSGIYLAKLQSGDKIQLKKMTVLK